MTEKVNDDITCIPIIDCPICEAKDVPLSHEATMTKGDKAIEIWQCSSCGKVPNIANNLKIKRYISINDLKAMGFSKSKPPMRSSEEGQK